MQSNQEARKVATEKATFGAGCFWQVEAEFRNTPGVTATRVGYAGGATESPTYEDVCTDRTGHAEVVEVEFDPERVAYSELLERFWSLHDPTQLNRQGPDLGTQYRSAIFFSSSEQEEEAVASKARAQARVDRPIVTEITPAGQFWPAEEYHQRYLEKRGLATCSI
jgi:peptide-methionine (S)-S-oxide reductase